MGGEGERGGERKPAGCITGCLGVASPERPGVACPERSGVCPPGSIFLNGLCTSMPWFISVMMPAYMHPQDRVSAEPGDGPFYPLTPNPVTVL